MSKKYKNYTFILFSSNFTENKELIQIIFKMSSNTLIIDFIRFILESLGLNKNTLVQLIKTSKCIEDVDKYIFINSKNVNSNGLDIKTDCLHSLNINKGDVIDFCSLTDELEFIIDVEEVEKVDEISETEILFSEGKLTDEEIQNNLKTFEEQNEIKEKSLPEKLMLVTDSDIKLKEILKSRNKKMLIVQCEMLRIDVRRLNKEQIIEIMLKYLSENLQDFLFLLNQDTIEYLNEIWKIENNQIISDIDWKIINICTILGILSLDMKKQTLYVVNEFKEELKFFLRGRSTKLIIQKYDKWEKIIVNILKTYGILEYDRLFRIFKGYVKEPISYEFYNKFIALRIEFWGDCQLIYEKNTRERYIATIYLYEITRIMNMREKLSFKNDFKKFSEEEILDVDLILSEEIQNVTEKYLDFLLNIIKKENLENVFEERMNYIINIIQNGHKPNFEMVDILFEDIDTNRTQRDEILKYFEEIAKILPSYVYKGYNEIEYNQIKKQNCFKILDGGKLNKEKKH